MQAHGVVLLAQEEQNAHVQHVGAEAPLAEVAQHFALAQPLREHIGRGEHYERQVKSREDAIVVEAQHGLDARIKQVQNWQAPRDVLCEKGEPADAGTYVRIFVERDVALFGHTYVEEGDERAEEKYGPMIDKVVPHILADTLRRESPHRRTHVEEDKVDCGDEHHQHVPRLAHVTHGVGQHGYEKVVNDLETNKH